MCVNEVLYAIVDLEVAEVTGYVLRVCMKLKPSLSDFSQLIIPPSLLVILDWAHSRRGVLRITLRDRSGAIFFTRSTPSLKKIQLQLF